MSSIDVLLGQHLEGIDPRHRAVYAGPAVDNEGWHVSWSNKDKRSPERDPAVLAQSIFGAPGARRGGTQSLDMLAVTEKDAASFRSKVGGGAQRQKADVFAESVQQLIKDIGDTKPPEPGCHPEHPDKLPVYDPSTRTQVQANHHKVVATALACGITRVATIQVARSAESLNILDVSNLINPHAAAHRGINQGSTGDPALDEAAWKGTRQWYTDQVKLFMDELARHTDPDFPEDNLLKHTLVVYTSELSDGYPEHRIDMPLLLMGGAGGLLKNGDGNGRYLNITAQGDDDHHTGNPVIGKRMVNMQRVWATIALAAGTQVPYGGNVSPITGIFRNVT